MRREETSKWIKSSQSADFSRQGLIAESCRLKSALWQRTLGTYENTRYSTNSYAGARRADLRAVLGASPEASICADTIGRHHRAGRPARRDHLSDALRAVLRGHQLRRRRRALSRTGEESLVRVPRPDDGLEAACARRGERGAATL